MPRRAGGPSCERPSDSRGTADPNAARSRSAPTLSTTCIAREVIMRTTLLVPLVLVSACTATGTDRSSPASPPAPAAPSVASSGPVAPATFDPAFAPLRGLLGRWQGSDPDRRSTGAFTLAPDLGGHGLVRRTH